MAFILHIVDQQRRNAELVEPLRVPADCLIHQQELSERGVFVDSIEDHGPSLGAAKHRVILPILQLRQNLPEDLQWECLDGDHAASRLAIAGTVDGHDVELLHLADAHQVLLEEEGVLVGGVPRTRPMNHQHQGLS